MLDIYVCEDIEKHRETIKDTIENTIIREKIDCQIISCTNNPLEILKHIKEKNNIGLYFLDIDLKNKINGIVLGEKIREIDPHGFIVFVTTHSEMSLLTFEYKVEAMDFIIKNIHKDIKERINKCILKAYERYLLKSKDDKVFSIKNDERVINIKFDEILFFEMSETIHKIRIHEINRQVEFYGKLKDIESNLDERFYRCHRAYIVNKNNIKEIDRKNRIIYMVNGEQCLVSTRNVKGLI